MITVCERGSALVNCAVPLTLTYVTLPEVMMWGYIAYDNRSTLVLRRTVQLDIILAGQPNDDVILQTQVGPFLISLYGAIFQHDNARSHTVRIAQDFIRHVETLPWPAGFPRHIIYGACVGSAETPYAAVSLCT